MSVLKYGHSGGGSETGSRALAKAANSFRNEAEKYHRKAIELKPDFVEAYTNLGSTLGDLGNLKEAEIFHRKAIDLKPDLAMAYSNLGSILKDLGNLKEAEKSIRKAIDLKPAFVNGYFSLSTFKYSYENERFYKALFSNQILNNNLQRDHVDLFFCKSQYSS